ncbi:MAG: MotA/TolQ/ExbB proton channel family protein [Myxococcales bacterium]
MNWSHIPGLDLLVRGGIMMAPLAVAAVLALAVICERLWVYRKADIRGSAALLRDRLRAAAAKGGAAEIVRLLEGRHGALGRVLVAGARARSPAEAEIAMAEEGRLTLMELESGLPLLDTMITLAPLLGLLGTITGMMGSFRLLSNTGIGHPRAVTGGIAEALIATATGLVIAVVTLVFHNFLQSRLARIEAELELHGEQLLILLREPPASEAPARASGA